MFQKMQVPCRLFRYTMISAGIALLASLSPPAGAEWPAPRGDSGRTLYRAGNVPAVSPPLALRGQYNFTGLGLLNSEMLLDGERLYTFSSGAIEAFNLVGDFPGTEPFATDEFLWAYRPLEHMTEDTMTSLVSVPFLVEDMIVFLERRVTASINEYRLFAVGRNRVTGEEQWSADLGKAAFGDLLVHNGAIYVFYDPMENEAGYNAFARIIPGEAAPSHLVYPEHNISGNYDGVLAATEDLILVRQWGRIFAYDAATLEMRWAYIQNTDNHGDAAARHIRDLIAIDGNVYASLTSSTHVYSVDREGQLRWAVDVDAPEDCGGHRFLSSDGERLFVSALCDDQLVAMDMASGGELWRATTPPAMGVPPAIAGDAIHLSTLATGQFFAVPAITAFDVRDGSQLDQFEAAEGASAFVRIASAPGLLYTLTDGGFSGAGTVGVLEREPAALGAQFALAGDLSECGVHQGTEVPVTVTFENLGPGTAPGATMTVRRRGADADFAWQAIPGVSVRYQGRDAIFELGDVEPFETISLDLVLTPLEQGEVRLETIVESAVRNPASEEEDNRLAFSVLPPIPSNLDIAITSIEVTQGIQDVDSSIPLVARKPTLIRAHLSSSDVITGVNAHLYVTGSIRPGNTRNYEDELVLPLEDCLTLVQGEGDREVLGQSFNFVLPTRFLNGYPDGPLEMRVVIDPHERLAVENRPSMTQTISREFNRVSPICLLTFPVKTNAQDGSVLVPDSRMDQSLIERAETLLPTPQIYDYPQSHVIDRNFTSNPYDFDGGGSQNTTTVMTKLWAQRFSSTVHPSCVNLDASVHYLGIVGENTFSSDPNRNFNGYAMLPGSALILRHRDAGSTGVNRPRGGMTLAHELGHNFLRFHVDCGGPSGAWSNFPHDPCTLGPLGPGEAFGIDLLDPANPQILAPRPASAPDTLGDLMSYADERWTSEYTWRGIYDKLRLNKKAAEQRRMEKNYFGEARSIETAWLDAWKSQSGAEILVAAVVDENGVGEIEELLSLDHGIIPQGNRAELAAAQKGAALDESPYSYQLLDDQGQLIADIPVAIALGQDAGEDVEMLNGILPDPAGLVTIRLVDEEGTALAERTRTPSAPEVSLLHPQGGTTEDDIIVVDWEATDADGDDLAAMIQYSADDGESWQTVALGIGAAPYSINAESLSGALGTARVRVIVSDGFNTGQATSEAFTLTPREPVASITRPSDGATFRQGEPIFLRARAFDPEDGHLLDGALAWHVNGDEQPDEGRDLLLTGLTQGTHEVTLQATDSDGNVATDVITIEVLPPMASRANVLSVLLGMTPVTDAVQLDRNLDAVIDAADLKEPESD